MKLFNLIFCKKKAETQSNVIMWLGVLITIFISLFWLTQNIEPMHLDLETVAGDLAQLQSHVNAACISDYYLVKFNPKTASGNLIINDSNICINNTIHKCRIALCKTEINFTLSLKNNTYLVIEKNNSFNFYGES
jgi:hypothetical protein